MTDSAPTNTPPGARFLRLFGDVSASEVRDVLLMFASIFLPLVAYYILKTVREPLILATGGAELKTYAAGAQAPCCSLYVPSYGSWPRRCRSQRWSPGSTCNGGVIQLFVVRRPAGVPVGFAFYVFVGIFSLTLIAQFWSFANDIYRKAEGDRLFPVIAVGATAGAPIGSAMAAELFARGLSPWAMMEIAAGLLLLHTWLYHLVRRAQLGRRPGESKKSSANGFALVLNSRYLRLIALLLVFLNIINTTGEYILANLVTEQANALAAG